VSAYFSTLSEVIGGLRIFLCSQKYVIKAGNNMQDPITYDRLSEASGPCDQAQL